MTDWSTHQGKAPYAMLQHIKKGLQAFCLGAMIAGFVTLGALGYQGWKLFHNPYSKEWRRAQAPSIEAATWAADVYRQEKREHLFNTGLIEIGLVVLCAGSWFAYRRLDKHLHKLYLDKQRESQKS